MPVVQNAMLVVHVAAFLTIVGMLWTYSPTNSAKVVFTQFYNGGGWSSIGLSIMVGQISAIWACICELVRFF